MLKALWVHVYPMLRWFALALLIALFLQAMPFDPLAVLFAGDLLAYFEIAAAVWLVAQVTRLRWAAGYGRFVVHRVIRRARVRAHRARRRIARLRPPSSDDEGRGRVLAFA